MVEELRLFCESKGWQIEELIDDDFMWADGFIIIHNNKHITIELDMENLFQVQIAGRSYTYNSVAAAKQALLWIVK
jgi:hypothetical protein